jgi:two-component system NtrC family response regulator
MAQPTLLIVEDDEAIRTQLKYTLRDDFVLAFAGSRAEAMRRFAEVHPHVVSLDLGLPPEPETAAEGLRTLEEILRASPSTKVIVVTGNGDRQNAVRALELGAFDYQSKPVNVDDFKVVLRRAAYLHDVQREAEAQATAGEEGSQFENIIGASPKMREIFQQIALVARADLTVLVQGDSGTGKELVAQAIHRRSPRKDRPFVAINCGAIPETLLEAELFGHEKGAFTGAHMRRKGKLELAEGGTLFLDEIGEMSLGLQVKLLRFLQEREIERLGGREIVRVNVRVVAATNKDLKAEIVTGRFREDLYFRLSVMTIQLPPLRERAEDILLIASTILRRLNATHGRRLRFSDEARAALVSHEWPGNVRELENALERVVILAKGGFIEPRDLGFDRPVETAESQTSLKEARRRVERELVVNALVRSRGNISEAARQLAISRPALHELIEKHQIDSRALRSGA